MQIFVFSFWVLAGMVGMEISSYILHRFVFHGLLWKIHKTHHEKSHGRFELNDLFSLGFGGLAMWLIISGSGPEPLNSPSLGLGIGISVYGILYFIIHDLYTHRRFLPFRSESRIMQIIRRAHQRHHQSIDKVGNEPYGLFLFDYELFRKKAHRRQMPDA